MPHTAGVRRYLGRCVGLMVVAVTVGLGIPIGQTHAEETNSQQLIVSVERIWDRAAHSAFTDLVSFRGWLYCTFREGSGHIPGLNGLIRVIRSQDGMNWESVALLDEPHVDLRDAKICATPDGRLMLNMGASYYEGSDRKRIESRVSFSDSMGLHFGPPQKVVLPDAILTGFDWLWRITWHEGVAWGCVQQVPPGKARSLQLVRSKDAVKFDHVATLPVEGPSETTLRFLSDGTLLAMIRRSGNPSTGQIGTARPPFTDWTLKTTSKSFGGPNLIELSHGVWLAGSRDREVARSVMALWMLDPLAGTLRDVITLPSGGDTSYPGFVFDEKNNRVLVSYYSSHEGKAAIYLATLRLDALQQPAAAQGDK